MSGTEYFTGRRYEIVAFAHGEKPIYYEEFLSGDVTAGSWLLVTRGEEGMSLFEENGDVTHIPTVAKEVYDVTGAGDTVISAFTLALAAGGGFKEAAYLSNYAAGIVVGKVGTATVTAEELIKAVNLE